MSDKIMSDRELTEYAEMVAADIADEINYDAGDDVVSDAIHEAADGCEHVIYPHRAALIYAHCNTDAGEAWAEDLGPDPSATLDQQIAVVVMGEIIHRVRQALDRIWSKADAPA